MNTSQYNVYSLNDFIENHLIVNSYYKEIEEILKQDNSIVNQENKNNLNEENYPLILAVNLGLEDIVELLLKYGANPNVINSEGDSAFINTLMFKNEKISKKYIQLFLDYGADVNIQDSLFRTALMYSIRLNHKNIVKLLLENGANPNLKDIDGDNSFSYNIDNNNIEITKLLLKYGINPNITDSYGKTIIMDLKDIESVKLLIKNGADVNYRNNRGQTPLMHSTNPEITKLLLDNNADINIVDNFGNTALSIAEFNGFTDIVKLLEVPPSISVLSPTQSVYGKKKRDKKRRTRRKKIRTNKRKSLLDLVEEEKIKEIRDNIDNYDVNYIFYRGTPNQMTPLIMAVYKNNIDIVKLLLYNGADTNIQNYYGETAIMFSDYEITKLLLENGANINIRDNQGYTVLDRPINDNKLELIKLFISNYKLKISDVFTSYNIAPDLLEKTVKIIYPTQKKNKKNKKKNTKKNKKRNTKKNKKRNTKKNKKRNTKRNK